MSCPFCGLDPYERVDVGLGGPGIAVAVTCCEYGIGLFDDRSEDRRYSKSLSEIAAELEKMKPGDAKMERAAQLLHERHPDILGRP